MLMYSIISCCFCLLVSLRDDGQSMLWTVAIHKPLNSAGGLSEIMQYKNRHQSGDECYFYRQEKKNNSEN